MIEVDAIDPDGDVLSYTWRLDGKRAKASDRVVAGQVLRVPPLGTAPSGDGEPIVRTKAEPLAALGAADPAGYAAEQKRLIAELKRNASPKGAALERGIRECFAELNNTGTCAVLAGFQRGTYAVALPVVVGRQRVLHQKRVIAAERRQLQPAHADGGQSRRGLATGAPTSRRPSGRPRSRRAGSNPTWTGRSA